MYRLSILAMKLSFNNPDNLEKELFPNVGSSFSTLILFTVFLVTTLTRGRVN